MSKTIKDPITNDAMDKLLQRDGAVKIPKIGDLVSGKITRVFSSVVTSF